MTAFALFLAVFFVVLTCEVWLWDEIRTRRTWPRDEREAEAFITALRSTETPVQS